MRSHNPILCAATLLSALLLGCAASHAPSGWLSNPTAIPRESYGGWLEMNYSTAANKKATLAGELLAVSADSFFLVAESFHAVARAEVKSARLEIYNSHSGEIAGLAFLGTLTTISNGAFLIFTAPLWIFGGIGSTAARSREPMVYFPKRGWSRLAAFARFPQGLPPDLDRRRIKMKLTMTRSRRL
jgi:hypothetical protein